MKQLLLDVCRTHRCLSRTKFPLLFHPGKRNQTPARTTTCLRDRENETDVDTHWRLGSRILPRSLLRSGLLTKISCLVPVGRIETRCVTNSSKYAPPPSYDSLFIGGCNSRLIFNRANGQGTVVGLVVHCDGFYKSCLWKGLRCNILLVCCF